MQADEFCRRKRFQDAARLMTENNLVWPPFPNTPHNWNPDRAEFTEEHKQAVRANGAKGGRPPGIIPAGVLISMATPEDSEKLIEAAAEAVMAGKLTEIKTSDALGPVTDKDRAAMTRLLKIPVEEFNAKFSDKLGGFAERVLEKMEAKLASDSFKPGELSFAMMVALQQRQNLDGRAALANANIAIQVNNFAGPKTKEEMIRSLHPDRFPPIPVPPADPEPAP